MGYQAADALDAGNGRRDFAGFVAHAARGGRDTQRARARVRRGVLVVGALLDAARTGIAREARRRAGHL